MAVTGTEFNYYFFCHRQLWLHAHQIQLENQTDQHSNVAQGKLLHEYSYPQRTAKYKELQLEGIKVDYYDHKTQTVHEIKLSDKFEETHIWQLKYYLYRIQKEGIAEQPRGILEYPKLKKTQSIEIDANDHKEIEAILQSIPEILEKDCPPVINKPYCKNCAYYEFCYIKE